MNPWCPPPTPGRQSLDFSQYWEAAAINKDGKAGEEGESAEAGERSAVQFSVLGLAVESDGKGKDRDVAERNRGGFLAAARVMSECVPAPTLLLLTLSEC